MTLGAYDRPEPADGEYGSERYRKQYERLYHDDFFQECAAPKQVQLKVREGSGLQSGPAPLPPCMPAGRPNLYLGTQVSCL